MIRTTFKKALLAGALCSGTAVFAQPTDVDITNWFAREKVKNADLVDAKRNPALKNMFLQGSFTTKNSGECVVMVPLLVGAKEAKYDYVILMQKTRSGWIDSHLLGRFVDDLKLRDVNKDGMMELWMETSGVGQGNIEGRYELVSFLDQNVSTLFSSEFFDLSSGAALTMEPGGMAVREVEIKFEDKDKDGVEEIIEYVKTQVLVSSDMENGTIKTEPNSMTILHKMNDKSGTYIPQE